MAREKKGSFDDLTPPDDFPIQRVKDWDAFLDAAPKEMDHYYYGLGAVIEPGVQPEMQRAIKSRLKEEYQNDLEQLNKDLGTKLFSWDDVGFKIL